MTKLLFAIAVALFPSVATSADSPPAEYIDKGACPFECCTYRAWNTTADTVAYAAPNKSAKVVGLLKAGGIVEAVTGEVHSLPVCFVVKRPHSEYRLGDVFVGLHVFGGGLLQSVAQWRNAERRFGFQPPWRLTGARCENNEQCWGELEEELKFSWWVKVKSKEGWEGWSN